MKKLLMCVRVYNASYHRSREMFSHVTDLARADAGSL